MEFSDEDLVRETRAGSQVAFGALMERYERLVWRVGYHYSHRSESAMDISQSVFLKAFRRIDTFSGEGPVKAWLLTIAHNESMSWLRKNRTERRVQERLSLDSQSEPSPMAGQDAELEDRERKSELLEELLQLNPKQRAAVSLRYFEGMPIAEIAGTLECSEGVARNILFRSLEKLRNRMTLRREVKP